MLNSKRILNLINEAGYTEYAVCKTLKWGNGVITKWDNHSPSVDKLVSLSDLTNIPLYKLLGDVAGLPADLNNKIANEMFWSGYYTTRLPEIVTSELLKNGLPWLILSFEKEHEKTASTLKVALGDIGIQESRYKTFRNVATGSGYSPSDIPTLDEVQKLHSKTYLSLEETSRGYLELHFALANEERELRRLHEMSMQKSDSEKSTAAFDEFANEISDVDA